MQESQKGLEVDFGSVTQTPFACYDPDSSSWRTWEHFLFEDSTSFSDRWPNSGMTHDGRAFELPTSVLPTSAIGYSSSVSLGTPSARAAKGANSVRVASGDTRGLLENQVATIPTPQARDGNHGGPQGKRYLNPERSNDPDDFVDALTKGMLLPTPRSQNGEPRNNKVWARPLDQPQNLENALALLPTPVVNDMGRDKTPEQWEAWIEGERAKGYNGNGHGNSLSIEVRKSTGAATKPPSDDGSPSPGQPPPR